MQHRGVIWLLRAILVSVALLVATFGSPPASRAQDDLVPHRLQIPLTNGARAVTLWVASGFDIGVAATDVPSARMLAQSPTGDLVVSQMFESKVSRLVDRDGDGVFD